MAILGILGNFFMFLVYSQPKFKKLYMSLFFRAIATSNLCINASAVWQFFDNFYSINLFDLSDVTCKLLNFILFVAGPLSAWFLAAAGVNSYLIIFYPSRFSFIKSFRFSMGTIFTICACNIAIYIHLFFSLYLSPSEDLGELSSFCDGSIGIEFSYVDFTNSVVLPFLVMFISSCAAFTGILRIRKRTENSFISDAHRRKHKRDIKYGVTMIFLNVTFLVFNAGHPILILIKSTWPGIVLISYDLDFFIDLFFNFLYYLFYSVLFYELLLRNKPVRKQFFSILKTLFRFKCSST